MWLQVGFSDLFWVQKLCWTSLRTYREGRRSRPQREASLYQVMLDRMPLQLTLPHKLAWILPIQCKTQLLPRLLQRSTECHGHYSTIYHATSQWNIRSYTHLYFWQNVKKSMHLKFKIMSITYLDFTFQLWCWPCIFRISM